MRKFGLIGKTLSHSFSKSYFESKFEAESITDAQYSLFELGSISELPKLIDTESLKGLNVTIPYKAAVIPFLDRLDSSAEKVGAVNVIDIGKEIVGYNSDYYGFKSSLNGWLPTTVQRALILGSGGSSKAIGAVFRELEIEYSVVSRNQGDYTYDDLRKNNVIANHFLIVNCTPLGMYPEESTCPDINYESLTSSHYLYDLVYNPEMTLFMKHGKKQGARTKGGIEMLHLQAEKSWEIWMSNL